MWSFNPAVYLQHAWESTNTVWGRVSLILFYTFIWVNIALAAWTIAVPSSQGMECIFDHASSKDLATISVLERGLNIYIIGFLFYADKGGLHSGNVGIVTVFTLVSYVVWMMFLNSSDIPACGAMWDRSAWIWPVWIVVAFITLLLDEKLGDRGTAEERQNLTV